MSQLYLIFSSGRFDSSDIRSSHRTVQPYELYFDNFFTNLPLLNILSEKGFRTTRSFRENGTEKCPIKPVELLKKEPRSSYDYRLGSNSGVLVVGWNHSNVVTLVATNLGFSH